MTIRKSPKPQVSGQEQFIQGAPDAASVAPAPSKAVGVMKGNKRQITLTIDPDTLNMVDSKADDLGMGRAGWINLAIRNAIENGINLGK